MIYHGFQKNNEVFQDVREFFQQCLKDPNYGTQIGISNDFATKKLAFYEKFPPGIHSRLSAHKIDVYLVNNPTWVKKGEFLVPKGSLESVLSLDFGSEIENACKQEEKMNEEIGKITIDLGDGTIVEGKRVRKSQYIGEKDKRIIPNDFLTIEFNSSEYDKSEDFFYNFRINKSAISIERPLEYHITRYLKFDNILVDEENEFVRALFTKDLTGFPHKFGHFVTTKK
jgi:hypothetical protein